LIDPELKSNIASGAAVGLAMLFGPVIIALGIVVAPFAAIGFAIHTKIQKDNQIKLETMVFKELDNLIQSRVESCVGEWFTLKPFKLKAFIDHLCQEKQDAIVELFVTMEKSIDYYKRLLESVKDIDTYYKKNEKEYLKIEDDLNNASDQMYKLYFDFCLPASEDNLPEIEFHIETYSGSNPEILFTYEKLFKLLKKIKHDSALNFYGIRLNNCNYDIYMDIHDTNVTKFIKNLEKNDLVDQILSICDLCKTLYFLGMKIQKPTIECLVISENRIKLKTTPLVKIGDNDESLFKTYIKDDEENTVSEIKELISDILTNRIPKQKMKILKESIFNWDNFENFLKMCFN